MAGGAYLWGVMRIALRTKNIKHLNELPDWFKLEKYESAKKLNAAGWYEQLFIRQGMLFLLNYNFRTDLPISGQVLSALEILRKTPIIDVNDNKLIRALFYGGALSEIKSGKATYSLGIHKLTVRELYQIENNIADEKRTSARNFFSQYFSEDFFDLSHTPIEYQQLDWIDEPVDGIRNALDNNVHVRVDLGLPDKILIEQFKQILHGQRKSLLKSGISVENKLRSDFKSWVNFGILPYLDLSVWAEIENVKISNRVMADAIFPEGEGGEEVVRKTTQKIADEILSESHLNKLAKLAAMELEEQINS